MTMKIIKLSTFFSIINTCPLGIVVVGRGVRVAVVVVVVVLVTVAVGP